MKEKIEEAIKNLEKIQRKTTEYDVIISYVKNVLKDCLEKQI